MTARHRPDGGEETARRTLCVTVRDGCCSLAAAMRSMTALCEQRQLVEWAVHHANDRTLIDLVHGIEERAGHPQLLE